MNWTIGATVSRTEIVNDLDPGLPCVSVAEQVTTTVPTGKVDPDSGEHVAGLGPSTESTADAVKVTRAPERDVASAVMLDGTATIGPVVSRTVTVNDPDPVLPCASVDVQFTVVVATGNVDPDTGSQLTGVAPSIASAPVTANPTTAPFGPVASVAMFAGTVTDGPVVSRTVTVNDPDPVLPCASVDVQTTGVVPSVNVDPDAGVQLTTGALSTRSLADALKVTTSPLAPVASAVMFAGTATAGGVVSTTVTWKLALALLPA